MRVNAFHLCHLFVRESKLDRADILFDLLFVAGANDCSGHGNFAESTQSLHDRADNRIPHLPLETFYQREIFRQLWFNKLHVAAPPIAVGEFWCSSRVIAPVSKPDAIGE